MTELYKFLATHMTCVLRSRSLIVISGTGVATGDLHLVLGDERGAAVMAAHDLLVRHDGAQGPDVGAVGEGCALQHDRVRLDHCPAAQLDVVDLPHPALHGV